MNKFQFLMQFIKDREIACLMPTSQAAVEVVCRPINFNQTITVVEYGPGNGVFCHYLLNKMTSDSTLIAIETNQELINNLKTTITDKRFSVCLDSAEQVREVIARYGLASVDYVISGIPFSFFDPDKKRRIVANTYKSLHAEGKFLVYQYSKHMMPYLKKEFKQVSSQFVLKNLPPMQLMIASKA